jgi:signal peptidase I
MEPTILSGEKFTAEMKPFQPLRGDLVIFHHEGVLIVKRVIAVGGDVVEGRDLKVLLNGKLLD